MAYRSFTLTLKYFFNNVAFIVYFNLFLILWRYSSYVQRKEIL